MLPWNDDDDQVPHGSPIITDTPLANPQELPPTHNVQNETRPEPPAGPSRGLKRVRDEGEVEEALPPPPAKLPRITAPQSLRHHLPELVDARDQEEALAAAPIVTLRAQVLEEAKSNNLIVVVPHIKASSILISQLLVWNASQELESPSFRTRCAVVLVDDISMMDVYVAHFAFEQPSLSVKKYTEDLLRVDFDAWTDMLKYDAILMPSKVMLDCLNDGIFGMSQLSHLVITDGQGIKNQDSHPSLSIVQIMGNFYLSTESHLRPRVFTLAVVGNSRRPHFDSKMLTLEITLDSKVFGIGEEKRAEILALPDRPEEIVLPYENPSPEDTRLIEHLSKLDPSENTFRRFFRSSRHVNHELGACAADLVWRRALKDIEADLDPWFDYDEDDPDASAEDRIKASTRDVVKNWPFAMPNLDRSTRGFNVSPKFLRLLQALLPFRHYGEGFRGIIFVQKRITALVLVDLLRTLDDRLGFLRPHALVGTSSEKAHQDIFLSFTTGHFNLLVGTKSMEDLDVPKASVVIRFDLFESQISHAYVRARTRGRESHLIHMVERGNDVHRRIVSRVTNIDTEMIRWTEVLCKGGDYGLPPSGLRETTNPYHSESEGEDEELSDQYLKDPTTGGRIYIQDATTVLFRYTGALRARGLQNQDDQGLFEYQRVTGGSGFQQRWIATVNLTETPIDGTPGDPSPTKAQARRSACFRACEVLMQGGYLDTHLIPIPSRLRPREELKHQPASGDQAPEPKTAGTKRYARKQPDFWTNANEQPSDLLYPSIVEVRGPDDTQCPYGPIAILTKKPLPDQRPFRLFSSGAVIHVRMHKAQPIDVTDEQRLALHRYTARICRGITNKAAVCEFDDAQYFFMPLSSEWKAPSADSFYFEDISPRIPWHLIDQAADNWAVPISSTSPGQVADQLDDAIVQDRLIEFTRRYRVVRVRHDLTPLSKPEDSQREEGFDNLFEFCKYRRRGLETLSHFEQPIAEVAKVSPVMNHLNPTCKPPSSPSKAPVKYLIPELCAKFTVPASTLRTAFLLPSIMRRIDDLLLVKELNAKYFDHVIREDLLHTAICTPAAGDAFLKYLSSVYVFVTNPSLNEGSLHVARQKLISNRSLLNHAVRIGLPAYIQARTFLVKLWLPPNYRIYVPPKASKGGGPSGTGIKGGNNKDKDDEDGHIPGIEDEENADADATRCEDSFDTSNVTDPLPDPDPGPQPEPPPAPAPAPEEEEDRELEPGELVEFPKPRIAPVEPKQNPKSQDTAQPTTEGAEADSKADVAVEGSSNPKKKVKNRKKKGQHDEQNCQWLGDKAVADVMEAVIGAAYISGGREAALQVTKSLNIQISNADRWSDFGRKVLAPPPNASARLAPSTIAAIEKIIGHKFARPHILAQAMTHGSIQGYESTSYERLEFLGDAILDFMVIRYIFDRDQQLSPGALTLLKGAMVSNSALAAVCVWSGLHEHFLYESAPLANSIEAYAQELQAQQRKEYALAKQEGRPVGQYWLATEPPKALSDVVESIIGAVYISDNFSPIGAEALFDNVLKPFYDKHITLQTLSHHPTKILFELVQAQGCQHSTITKEKLGEDGYRCSVIVHDVVLAMAQDTSAATAARQVSYFALDALEGDADFMTRTCDCRLNSAPKRVLKRADFERALEQELKEDGEQEETEEARDAAQMVEA